MERSLQKKRKIQTGKIKIFLKKHYDKLDSVFGWIVGVISTVSVILIYQSYTIPQIIEYIKPFGVPMILMVLFSYCMKKAFEVMKNRAHPLKADTFWQGFWGNLISIGWIIGGLLFVASTMPEVLTALIAFLEK